MFYTLGQAAKATEKHKATIALAVKSGRISANRDQSGQYQIDIFIFSVVKSYAPQSDSRKSNWHF